MTAKDYTKNPLVEWRKVKGKVIKKTDAGVFVDCDDGLFTAVILQKEVRDLEKNKFDLSVWAEIEAELINPDIRHKEWYYIVSISRLLQIDVWNSLIWKAQNQEVFTVVPTEANLWWLLVDMYWIKGFIPLSQLAPIHYPRVEDWDQEAIFNKLLDLIGKEFKVKIISVDEDEKRIILSEREALKEETQKILSELKVWNVYEWIVSWLSSYWFFVTLWWSVEWLVHISEITYWHVNDISRLAKVWDKIKVKVIWLENWKISLSSKQLKEDPRNVIKRTYKVWDVIEWEVVRFVPYWVFVRMYDDINWLIHLSELLPADSEQKDADINNPASVVKLWQVVKAKVITLDFKNRKIWLSMRALYETEEESRKRLEAKQQKNKKYKTYTKKEETGEEEKHEVKKYSKSEKEVEEKEDKKSKVKKEEKTD